MATQTPSVAVVAALVAALAAGCFRSHGRGDAGDAGLRDAAIRFLDVPPARIRDAAPRPDAPDALDASERPDAGRDAPRSAVDAPVDDAGEPFDAPLPPRDGGSGMVGCLGGPVLPVPDREPRELWLDPDSIVSEYWRRPISAGDVVIVPVGGAWVARCLAAIRGDLTVAWGTPLPAEVAHPHLVRMDGAIALFLVGRGLLRWAEVDAASGALSPWRSAPGRDVEFEWSAVAAVRGGGFVVVWNEGWEIVARGYDAMGVPRGDPVTVTTNGRYPYAARDPERVLLGYHELLGGAVSGPLAIELDASGRPLGAPRLPEGASVYGGSYLIMERDAAGLVGAWRSTGTVVYARIDESLRALGAPVVVASGPSWRGPNLRDVAVTPRGTLVGWGDYDGRGGVTLVGERWTGGLGIRAAEAPFVGVAGSSAIALWSTGDALLGARVSLP